MEQIRIFSLGVFSFHSYVVAVCLHAIVLRQRQHRKDTLLPLSSCLAPFPVCVKWWMPCTQQLKTHAISVFHIKILLLIERIGNLLKYCQVYHIYSIFNIEIFTQRDCSSFADVNQEVTRLWCGEEEPVHCPKLVRGGGRPEVHQQDQAEHARQVQGELHSQSEVDTKSKC